MITIEENGKNTELNKIVKKLNNEEQLNSLKSNKMDILIHNKETDMFYLKSYNDDKFYELVDYDDIVSASKLIDDFCLEFDNLEIKIWNEGDDKKIKNVINFESINTIISRDIDVYLKDLNFELIKTNDETPNFFKKEDVLFINKKEFILVQKIYNDKIVLYVKNIRRYNTIVELDNDDKINVETFVNTCDACITKFITYLI